MKKSLIIASCLLIASSLAFAQGQNEPITTKKNIVVAVQSLPQSSIAAMAEISNVANRIDFSIEETLVQTDYYDNNKQKPGLAESWKLVDDTTIIFNLRKGVKFHNGEEMTAEDVAFTFGEERFLGLEAPGRATAGAFLGNLKSVTALDRYTVEIKIKNPDAILITRFANLPSQIISKKAYLDAGGWDAFSRLPVGTGPYKVTEFTDSVRVVLERFDQYWGSSKAAVDRIEFRYVPELSTRIAGLRSGEFDIITEIPPDQAAAIQKMPGISVVGGPIQNIYGMFFDETNSSPMQNPKFREALTLAVDREKLVRTLFSSLTTVPNNWQSELFGAMYLKDYPGVSFNPTRAKQLLKEAGYAGEKIYYRSLPGYYTLEQTVAEAVTQMWQSIGINIELQIKENWTQINEDNDTRHIINGSFSAYYPDPVGQVWRRFGTSSPNTGKLWNLSKEVQDLGKIMETSYDVTARLNAFKTYLDLFSKDPKGMYLYNLPMIYAIRDGVEWKPLAIEGMDFTTNALEVK